MLVIIGDSRGGGHGCGHGHSCSRSVLFLTMPGSAQGLLPAWCLGISPGGKKITRN